MFDGYDQYIPTLKPDLRTKSREEGTMRWYSETMSSLRDSVNVGGRVLSQEVRRGSQPSMSGSMYTIPHLDTCNRQYTLVNYGTNCSRHQPRTIKMSCHMCDATQKISNP